MLSRRRVTFVCLLFLLGGACTPPKPPSPPAMQQVTVALIPPVAGCTIHLAGTNYTADWAQLAPAVFTQVPWALTSVTASAACGSTYTSTPVTAPTGGNGKTAITLTLTPTIQPLPPPPTRDALAHAHACFQGLRVTTKQLGTVPSFGGVETGMLTDVEDRQATYAAIKAAGCNAIVLDVYVHYTEPGVVYPNGTAASNDWTTDHWQTLTARVAEAADAGLMTVLMQGADELPFETVQAQAAPMATALRTYPRGDETAWVNVGLGFDSIWPLANADPYQVNNQRMVNAILATRAAFGPSGVLNLEFPNGVAFGGGGSLSGAGWYQSAAGRAINTYLQEFANVSPGNDPTPVPIGGVWDSEHGDFAPTTTVDVSPWQQVWQVAARTLTTWRQPPDEVTQGDCPGANTVPVTGNPTVTTACVFFDVTNPAIYPSRTPSDIQVFIAAEFGTYQDTHGQTTPAQIQRAARYLAGVGYPVVWAPSTPSTTRLAVRR